MPELPYDEEILDLVDEHNQVVGTVTHEEIFDHANLRGNYLRAVNAFLINSQGKLWIPRRLPEKIIVPNGLDYSVGEHVMSGESNDDAIVRGFAEEVNMTVRLDELTLFSETDPADAGIPYFCANYYYLTDIDPDYNRDDFSGAEWLTPQELIDRLKQGDKGKQSLIRHAQDLLDYQAQSHSHK